MKVQGFPSVSKLQLVFIRSAFLNGNALQSITTGQQNCQMLISKISIRIFRQPGVILDDKGPLCHTFSLALQSAGYDGCSERAVLPPPGERCVLCRLQEVEEIKEDNRRECSHKKKEKYSRMSEGGINFLLTQVSGRSKMPMAAFSWIRADTKMYE